MELVLEFVLLICIGLVGFGNGHLHHNNIVDVTSFGAVGDGLTDDSKAFLKAWEDVCGTKGSQTLIISSGKTFKLQPLVFKGPCKSTTITFRLLGKIRAPTKSEWAEHETVTWVTFKGVKNLIVQGPGVIEASGATWWEDKRSTRPTSLAFSGCNDLQLKSITSINSARNHISIVSCNGVTISDMNLFAPKDSPNTDGIDVSASSQVSLFDSFIGTGDDCVAINAGSSAINITNVNCGPGHGLSVGSLGRSKTEDIVEHVHIKNCTFNGTQNGARIKTVPGGSGYAKNIIFEDIILINTENPIVIDQHYRCKHSCPPTTSAVEVSNVTFKGFHGSAIKQGVQLICSEVKPCNGIVLDDINIVPAIEGETLEVLCNNVGVTTVKHTIPAVSCLPKP